MSDILLVETTLLSTAPTATENERDAGALRDPQTDEYEPHGSL